MIGECVVVGGVRRSALISLSNLSDQRMRDAKSGEWWVLEPQRRIANNSVAYTEQPEVGQYMEEWMSLYASKSGERGIFNREAARIQAMKNERRKGNLSNGIEPRAIDFGTNPCVSGDTPILTSHGYYEISDLVDQPVQIWNGEQWSSVVPFSTGMNETVIVTFSDGTSLHCTPYHMFLVWDGWSRGGNERRVCAEDLRPGDKLTKYDMPFVNEGSDPNIDGYSQGFYAGDGNHGLNHSWLYEPKYSCAARLVGDIKKDGDRLRKRWTHGPMLDRRFVPVKATSAYCLEWLAGLLDSDGTVTKDKQGSGFQITSIDKTFLLHTQLMLTRLGIRAKVVRGHESREKDMPGGTYYCQKTWRLLIGNTDSAYLISKGLQLSRLEHDGQIPQRDARQFVRVISVYDAGPHETFCFTDSLANRGTFNGIVTGNCGEIILRPKQFCNLSTVVVRPDDNPDTLEEKVRLATILGTWQSTLTKFRYLTKKWQDNCEEERLLGVSMTGIMANPLLNGRSASGLGGTANLLLRLKEVAISTNKEWAERLGIPQSAAVTCIKPEGTSSQLVNTPSGMHTAFSKYYIRTVRQDAKDPLTQMMIDQGVPYEIDVMNKENVVFSFPAESPEGSVLRNDMSALEQLEHWKVFHDNWCEHNPSITVYVREKEWPSVGAWVWDNFDSAGGLAFLPHTDHTYKQAPYQEITKEKYQEVLAAMPEIDWSGLSKYESEDNTNNTRELACSAGICDII
jgi:ribonucleotide reductase alpha subunit